MCNRDQNFAVLVFDHGTGIKKIPLVDQLLFPLIQTQSIFRCGQILYFVVKSFCVRRIIKTTDFGCLSDISIIKPVSRTQIHFQVSNIPAVGNDKKTFLECLSKDFVFIGQEN